MELLEEPLDLCFRASVRLLPLLVVLVRQMLPLRHGVAQQRPLVLLGTGKGGVLGVELYRHPLQLLLLQLLAVGRRHVTVSCWRGGGTRLRTEKVESQRPQWEEQRKIKRGTVGANRPGRREIPATAHDP